MTAWIRRSASLVMTTIPSAPSPSLGGGFASSQPCPAKPQRCVKRFTQVGIRGPEGQFGERDSDPPADPPFLNPMAGDERGGRRKQQGQLAAAAGIGERAARVERAALGR